MNGTTTRKLPGNLEVRYSGRTQNALFYSSLPFKNSAVGWVTISLKVAESIPHWVSEIFHLPYPSGLTVALGVDSASKIMSTRYLFGG